MSKFTKIAARVTLAGVSMIGLVAVAGSPVHAARARQGSTPASCDVVDTETGRVVGQVPEGTRSGLFYCGSDGEWHFGTVILDWSRVVSEPAPEPTSPKKSTFATSTWSFAR